MKYKKLIVTPPKHSENEEVSFEKLLDFNRDVVPLIEHRAAGVFEHRAFFLPSTHDWVLGKDSGGDIILVPLRIS